MTSRNTSTLVLFLHLRCRGGPSDLQFRLGLAQLPDLHHLLGLVRAELWAELQLVPSFQILLLQDPGDGGGPLALILRVELRAQSAGLVLQALMLPVERMLAKLELLRPVGHNCTRPAQASSRLRPSPRRPPAHVQKIPAWAPCLRPLTPLRRSRASSSLLP